MSKRQRDEMLERMRKRDERDMEFMGHGRDDVHWRSMKK